MTALIQKKQFLQNQNQNGISKVLTVMRMLTTNLKPLSGYAEIITWIFMDQKKKQRNL